MQVKGSVLSVSDASCSRVTFARKRGQLLVPCPHPQRCTTISCLVAQGLPLDVHGFASLPVCGLTNQFGTLQDAGKMGVVLEAAKVWGFLPAQRQAPSNPVHAATSICACERVSGTAGAGAGGRGESLEGLLHASREKARTSHRVRMGFLR